MNLKANTKNFRFKKVWNSDGDGLTNAMSELYVYSDINNERCLTRQKNPLMMLIKE